MLVLRYLCRHGFRVSSWLTAHEMVCSLLMSNYNNRNPGHHANNHPSCMHGGKSLRDIIEHDDDLADDDFQVVTHRRQGRNPGWAVLKSNLPDRRGTIRLEWIDSPEILFCRVVNRGAGRPDLIVGDFVSYLFKRHRKRLKLITIFVDKSRARHREH